MLMTHRQLVLFVLMLMLLLAFSGCNFVEDIQKTATAEKSQTKTLNDFATESSSNGPTMVPKTLTPENSLTPTFTNPSPTEIQYAITTSPFIRGMNIGNALEAPEPGLWGVTIQEAYLQTIADAGFNTVRIPARFSAHISGSPDFTIDQDFLDTVDQVINWGLNAELIVILDFHGFDEIMQAPLAHEEKFLSIWGQLAEYYQAYPESLWFDLINEPSNNLDANTWNWLIHPSVSIIRQSNPTRKILIGGVNYSKFDTLNLLDLPNDPNLIAAFHFYTPFEFTHQGASWVEGTQNWLGTTWQGTDSQKEVIRSALDQAMIWSQQTQTPIIMSEFGAINQADPESRQHWISFVAREAEQRNISWLYWGFCSNLGVYNCEELTWDHDLLEALIQP
jgi:endoglucanase